MFGLLLFPLFALLNLFSDGSGGGGEGNGDPPEGDGKKPEGDGSKPKVGFSEDQQREVNRMLARERKAERDRALADAKAEADRKAEEDRKARERADAEAKGDFEKVKSDLTTERDTIAGERDDLKARYDRALAIITPQVEADWKDLPEEVTALYEGADDDILAKAAHLHRTKALREKLAGTAKPGNPRNPTVDGLAGDEIKSPISKREILG